MTDLLMTIAFLPLAAVVGTCIFRILRPPKHRPLIFFAGGSFMLLFGALFGFALRPALQSGVVHFTSRRLGEIHAASAHEPLEYWATVLMLYIIAVFLAGFGFAGFGLCFRRDSGR